VIDKIDIVNRIEVIGADVQAQSQWKVNHRLPKKSFGNSLPKDLHHSSISLLSFKSMLKTYLVRS